MKKAFTKFSEAYLQTFQESRFLTQIFAFPMAIVLFLYSSDLIYRLNTYNGEISPELWISVKADLIVILLTAALFASRFLLLFSRNIISFWFSQFIWLATIITIYWQISPPPFGVVCAKNMLPAYDQGLGLILMSYLFFSPIRQLITLVASIARIFAK